MHHVPNLNEAGLCAISRISKFFTTTQRVHACLSNLESIGTLYRKRLTEVEMKKIIEDTKNERNAIPPRLEPSIPTITKREGITQSGR